MPATTAIVGLGVTGLSAARHLAAASSDELVVIDTRAAPPGLSELLSSDPAAELRLGQAKPSFKGVDRAVVSPGMALDDPALADARKRGIELTSDIELFLASAEAPVVAVTGTNGKSTVTALVGDMLSHAGLDVGVGGNIGVAALDLLGAERDAYVLELSSFQLERLRHVGARAATILNVSDDHMDRYAGFADYVAAKQRVYRGVGTAVTNRADAATTPSASVPEQVTFGLDAPDAGGYGVTGQGEAVRLHLADFEFAACELALPGRHNQANAQAATALALQVGANRAAVEASLASFAGLPHRCQRVAVKDEVVFVNDSKATNVGAALAAIQGLAGERDLILIAGGEGKGADFAPLADAMVGTVALAVLIGRDAALIEAALAGRVPVQHAESMADAVAVAARAAKPGQTVLLAPACASFDQFDSYTQRGDVFTASVRELAA